ncbi:MAG: hypothetical protein AAFU50_09325 [Pseudomonadota bacterium]
MNRVGAIVCALLLALAISASGAQAGSTGLTFVNEDGVRFDVPAGTGLTARVERDPTSNSPMIHFVLPPDMTLLAMTRDQVGRRIRIYVGCKLVSEPVVRTPISGRQGVLTGAFSLEEAKAFADIFNNGAPPCPNLSS